MAVRRKYVRKHVVGGSGIGDFFRSAGRKIVNLFSRAKPTLSRIANSDVGKALTSAGKDLAVAGIGGAKDYAVSKIAEKVQAVKAASAVNAANSENIDNDTIRRMTAANRPITSVVQPTRKPATISEALSKNYSNLLSTPSGGSIKMQEYARKIRGSGLRKCIKHLVSVRI